MNNAYVPEGIDSSFYCMSEGCRYPGEKHGIPTSSVCSGCGRVNPYIRWEIGRVNRLMREGTTRPDAVAEVLRLEKERSDRDETRYQRMAAKGKVE